MSRVRNRLAALFFVGAAAAIALINVYAGLIAVAALSISERRSAARTRLRNSATENGFVM